MSNLEEQLRALACKYEKKEFLDGDPSWFMHQVEGDANKELLAFVASALSYGSRAQFLPKIRYVLECSGGDILVQAFPNDTCEELKIIRCTDFTLQFMLNIHPQGRYFRRVFIHIGCKSTTFF